MYRVALGPNEHTLIVPYTTPAIVLRKLAAVGTPLNVNYDLRAILHHFFSPGHAKSLTTRFS
jgi:hypothetical protein